MSGVLGRQMTRNKTILSLSKDLFVTNTFLFSVKERLDSETFTQKCFA